MRIDLNEFLDERDEWHYFWVGVAVGYVVARTLMILTRR